MKIINKQFPLNPLKDNDPQKDDKTKLEEAKQRASNAVLENYPIPDFINYLNKPFGFSVLKYVTKDYRQKIINVLNKAYKNYKPGTNIEKYIMRNTQNSLKEILKNSKDAKNSLLIATTFQNILNTVSKNLNQELNTQIKKTND